MRNLFLATLILCFSSAAYAGTSTAVYTLYKPDINEQGWGLSMSQNMDKIETALERMVKKDTAQTMTQPLTVPSLVLNGSITGATSGSFSGNVSALTFTEGGTLLSSKYLGINAAAQNSLQLDGVAAASYLLSSTASSTYLTQANAASTYLTQASASSTYLTQVNAATLYLQVGGGNSVTATGFTLQSAASPITKINRTSGQYAQVQFNNSGSDTSSLRHDFTPGANRIGFYDSGSNAKAYWDFTSSRFVSAGELQALQFLYLGGATLYNNVGTTLRTDGTLSAQSLTSTTSVSGATLSISGAAGVGSLNAGTGAIQTTGTLSAGGATVTSLNAGSGTIQTTGALQGGAATVTSLNAGSGAIQTTGSLSSGGATVTSLNAGSGTIQTTGALQSGAATVTSLNAGSGAIQTTGSLGAGAATVTSLNAGSGAIQTTGTITGTTVNGSTALQFAGQNTDTRYVNATSDTMSSSYASNSILTVNNTSAASGATWGINGTSSGSAGIGVRGAGAYGVGGVGSIQGVFGIVQSGATAAIGVYGNTDVANNTGAGVKGVNNGTNNTGYGVHANNTSTNGYALYADGTKSYISQLGVGTTGPDRKLDVLDTTTQLRLTYTDGTVYTDFTTNSSGDLTISPSGGDTTVTGNLFTTKVISATVESAGALMLRETSGTTQLEYVSGQLRPGVGTIDIGSSISKFRDGYFSGTIQAGTLASTTLTANTLSAGGALTLSAASGSNYVMLQGTMLRPYATTVDIGGSSAADKFRSGYFSGTLTAATANVTTLNVNGVSVSGVNGNYTTWALIPGSTGSRYTTSGGITWVYMDGTTFPYGSLPAGVRPYATFRHVVHTSLGGFRYVTIQANDGAITVDGNNIISMPVFISFPGGA